MCVVRGACAFCADARAQLLGFLCLHCNESDVHSMGRGSGVVAPALNITYMALTTTQCKSHTTLHKNHRALQRKTTSATYMQH